MYNIEVDSTKKLVKFKASGFFQLNDAKTILEEFKKALTNFKPKEAVLLTDVAEFKASSPEVIPYIREIQALGIEHFRKFASIQASGIANMQLTRVAKDEGINESIKRFQSEDEALKYLFA